jgi:hypothetical protein
MKKLLMTAGLISAVASFGVSAQTFKPQFYAGAELGYAALENNAQTFANSLVATNGGSASVTQNSGIAVGRIFGGYKVLENVDLELGAAQTSNVNYNFSALSRTGVPYSGTTSVSVMVLDYSVLLRPSISTGFNNLYVRLGGTWANETASTSGTNVTGGSGSYSGSGYLYGLGYDQPIDKTFNARFQINRLQNIAGQSSDNATVFSIGLLGKF